MFNYAYILKAFSVKKNCGSFSCHFGSFWVILGPFWAMLGHIWATLGHFWPFLGHFMAFLDKFAKSSIFVAGSLGSRYSLLECLQFCSTYNFKQSYEGAMHKGTNNSFLCSHWLLHILAKKEETNQGEAQQVLI